MFFVVSEAALATGGPADLASLDDFQEGSIACLIFTCG